MPITALPTPPTRADASNFATRADAFMTALPPFGVEANALQADVNSKQGTASTAATTATTKAGEASTSASNASTSEGNALTYRNAAQVAQVAAEAALDYFDDRYLGAKAVAPTVDNDGNALLTGALYFDTALVTLRVRTAAAAWLSLPSNTASATAFTPAGGIAATEVQGAIVELDTEKYDKTGGAINGRAFTPPASVAFSAAPTFNAALSNVHYFGAMTGSVTSVTISNPADGQTINIRFAQDGTGTRTVTLPASIKAFGSVVAGASRVSFLVLTYVASAARWEGSWQEVPA